MERFLYQNYKKKMNVKIFCVVKTFRPPMSDAVDGNN